MNGYLGKSICNLYHRWQLGKKKLLEKWQRVHKIYSKEIVMAIQHQMNILNFIHNEENGKIIIVRCRFLHPRIVQIPKVWNTLCWPECGRAKRPRLHRRWGREQVRPSRKARWHCRSQLQSPSARKPVFWGRFLMAICEHDYIGQHRIILMAKD